LASTKRRKEEPHRSLAPTIPKKTTNLSCLLLNNNNNLAPKEVLKKVSTHKHKEDKNDPTAESVFVRRKKMTKKMRSEKEK